MPSDLQLLLALLLVTFVVAVIAQSRRRKADARRLDRIVNQLRALADGDLTVRAADGQADALGEIGRLIDALATRLQRLHQRATERARQLGEVAGSLWPLADAVDLHPDEPPTRPLPSLDGSEDALLARLITDHREIDRALQNGDLLAREAAACSPAIAGACRDLTALQNAAAEITDRAQSAARVAAGLASGLRDLEDLVDRARDGSSAAARLAERAGNDAAEGQAVLGETIDGIGRIARSSQAIRTATEAIERRSEEVGSITGVVAALAAHTKLLALNASVLAAQAGSEGRGFAVVAQEIEELAKRTSQSAEAIAQRVAVARQDAHAARQAAETGAAIVEASGAQAARSATALRDLYHRVRESAQLSLSMATMTEEELGVFRQLGERTEELAAVLTDLVRRTTEQLGRGHEAASSGRRLEERLRWLDKSVDEHRDLTAVRPLLADVAENVRRALGARQDAQAAALAELRARFDAKRAAEAMRAGAAHRLGEGLRDLAAQSDALRREIETLGQQ